MKSAESTFYVSKMDNKKFKEMEKSSIGNPKNIIDTPLFKSTSARNVVPSETTMKEATNKGATVNNWTLKPSTTRNSIKLLDSVPFSERHHSLPKLFHEQKTAMQNFVSELHPQLKKSIFENSADDRDSKTKYLAEELTDITARDPTLSQPFRDAFVMNTKMVIIKSRKGSIVSRLAGNIEIEEKNIKHPLAKEGPGNQTYLAPPFKSPERRVKNGNEKPPANQTKLIREPSIGDMITEKSEFTLPSNRDVYSQSDYQQPNPPQIYKQKQQNTVLSMNHQTSIPRLGSMAEVNRLDSVEDMPRAPMPSTNFDEMRDQIAADYAVYLLGHDDGVKLSKNTDMAVRRGECKALSNFNIATEKMNLSHKNWQHFIEAYDSEKPPGEVWSYIVDQVQEVKAQLRKKPNLFDPRLVESIKRNYDKTKVGGIIQKFLPSKEIVQAFSSVVAQNLHIHEGKTLNPYLVPSRKAFKAVKRSRISEHPNKAGDAASSAGFHLKNLRRSQSRKTIEGNHPGHFGTHHEEIRLAELSRNPELNQIVRRSQRKPEYPEADITKKMDDIFRIMNGITKINSQLQIATVVPNDHYSSLSPRRGIPNFMDRNPFNDTFNLTAGANPSAQKPHFPFSFSIGSKPLSFAITSQNDVKGHSSRKYKPFQREELLDPSQNNNVVKIVNENPYKPWRERMKTANWGHKILVLLRKLNWFRMTITEAMRNKLFPKREDPHHPLIQTFLLAIKQDNREKVLSMLIADRYIVYYFDAVGNLY